MEYKVMKHGQITKFEAGTIYRAMKNGDIQVMKETTSGLYDATNDYIRFASERYNQKAAFYDNIYSATRYILAGEFEKAQEEIDSYEKRAIDLAGKRSPYYKYQKKEEI